jgi:hypothetical protein
MSIRITAAEVALPNGTVVAYIEAIAVGGGTQVVMVDGKPEQRQHPLSHCYHARLLSQAGRMISDEIVDAETYEDACKAGEAYARKVQRNAKQIAELRDSLASGDD